jgi:hypothetical protein
MNVARREIPAIYAARLEVSGPALDRVLLRRLRDPSPAVWGSGVG